MLPALSAEAIPVPNSSFQLLQGLWTEHLEGFQTLTGL